VDRRQSDLIPELGIIEGYFGRSWSWDSRAAVLERLAPAGYSFFHYAPKFDEKLRRDWQCLHDKTAASHISEFAERCRAREVRFGIGITPYGAHLDFDRESRDRMKAKLAQFDCWGIVDLAVLFDDMRGELPDLAARQAEVADFIFTHSKAERFFFCPSYYSLDPKLDAVFGLRPLNYLEELGRRLDRSVAIYWTGEEVCAPEVGAAHLRDMAEIFGRKVALWDNYPVNDGPRMSQYLHLRAFTGRSASIGTEISHHAINPALQPMLGCIPALTLPMLYGQKEDYRYSSAFAEAARAIGGAELAATLQADLLTLQQAGLDRLSAATRVSLRNRYSTFGNDAAQEIVDWLDGAYAITGEMLQTQ
jgi:hyaluronoglucosaminidase